MSEYDGGVKGVARVVAVGHVGTTRRCAPKTPKYCESVYLNPNKVCDTRSLASKIVFTRNKSSKIPSSPPSISTSNRFDCLLIDPIAEEGDDLSSTPSASRRQRHSRRTRKHCRRSFPGGDSVPLADTHHSSRRQCPAVPDRVITTPSSPIAPSLVSSLLPPLSNSQLVSSFVNNQNFISGEPECRSMYEVSGGMFDNFCSNKSGCDTRGDVSNSVCMSGKLGDEDHVEAAHGNYSINPLSPLLNPYQHNNNTIQYHNNNNILSINQPKIHTEPHAEIRRSVLFTEEHVEPSAHSLHSTQYSPNFSLNLLRTNFSDNIPGWDPDCSLFNIVSPVESIRNSSHVTDNSVFMEDISVQSDICINNLASAEGITAAKSITSHTDSLSSEASLLIQNDDYEWDDEVGTSEHVGGEHFTSDNVMSENFSPGMDTRNTFVVDIHNHEIVANEDIGREPPTNDNFTSKSFPPGKSICTNFHSNCSDNRNSYMINEYYNYFHGEDSEEIAMVISFYA
jgi:hypothetical protein